MILEKQIKQKLTEVLDPELGISIVDLGLIYKIEIKDNNVKVVMTLTTVACPLGPMIQDEVKEKVKQLGVKKVKVELVFDPPWNFDMLTKKGKKSLGI